MAMTKLIRSYVIFLGELLGGVKCVYSCLISVLVKKGREQHNSKMFKGGQDEGVRTDVESWLASCTNTD